MMKNKIEERRREERRRTGEGDVALLAMAHKHKFSYFNIKLK